MTERQNVNPQELAEKVKQHLTDDLALKQDLLEKAVALLEKAKVSPSSTELINQLWDTRVALVNANLDKNPEGLCLRNALHEQWMRHRY